jgi:Tfp pilus assembly protein PilZ
MDKPFGTSFVPAPIVRKAAARTALVGLNESTRTLLAECFRQFNIETVAMSSDAAERLNQEKFEACVLGLGEGADSVMEAVRRSASNSRCVIYGVGGDARDAMRYSKYGINAVFKEPLERPAALKLVRATRTLVQHELRRYVRIPVMTEVSIVGDGRRVSATSIELSAGGLSVQSAEEFSTGTNIEVSFSLLTLPRVSVRGAVTWRKPKKFGVQFDAADQRRQKIKAWIDSCLDN